MLDAHLFPRRKLRLVRQVEATECGLACLTMIANYHHLDIDLGTMRRRFGLSSRGATLRNLLEAADGIDFNTRAVKLPLERIDKLQTPAVLHWNLNHFVVLEAVRGNRAMIHNPAGFSGWTSMADLSDHFTGVALELQPNEDFEPRSERENVKLSQLVRNVPGLKRALLQTLVLTLVLQAFVLATPYFSQLAIDSALPAQDLDLLLVLALGFGLFTAINATASLLRDFVFLVSGSTLGYVIATRLGRRLFRLPIGWFERRQTGDILSRFHSVRPVKEFMTRGAIAGLVDGSLAFVVLIVMLYYNLMLSAIAVAALLVYLIVRAITFRLERASQEATIVAMGREQTTLIETLRGMTTLRLFGRENMRHAIWQSRLTETVNADIHVSRIRIWQTTANQLAFGIENVASIWLAVSLVISGEGFSIGMLFAYMAYKTQFMQRSISFVDQIVAFRLLGLHMERLSDIALTPQDPSFDKDYRRRSDMLGRVELRAVYYRYSEADPFVVCGANLVVEPGEHIAITGPSGGGKSTIVKLLLGLLEPTAGQVLYDGDSLLSAGFKSLGGKVAAVLQDDNLFTGSISENIALFDEVIDMDKVEAAARAAHIDADIQRLPMRYETLVGEMGSTLSGGQRQRMLLARALYREPRVLILDEGTAHLDDANERAVTGSISRLGITLISIAHRQETIAAAQRIYVVENGELRAEGDTRPDDQPMAAATGKSL